MRYRCDTKVIQGKPCPHNCVVDAEVRPVSCIRHVVAEYWTAEGETSDRLCPQCKGPAKVTGVSGRGGEDIQCPKCGYFYVTPKEGED